MNTYYKIKSKYKLHIMTLQEMRKTIARRIEDFRKKLGLSQKQLAERVEDLTASAIEKFEKAEIAPSPQTLSRLAEALNVMNDDLIRPYVIDIDYRKVRYRKRSKMPKKQVEALQRKYGLMLERYIEVERLMGQEAEFNFNYDDIQVSKYEDAQNVARRFREDMGWGIRPIVSPIQQLEMKGVKVFILDEDESTNKDFDGMCYKEGKIAVVVLKKCENTEHDRFTLFHEMGHLLMNTGDLEGKELEALCNAFASEMLLPESEFRNFFWKGCRIYPITLQMLQREWGISCMAQMYKAKDLDIITDNRYIGYCVRLNRNKALKAEMEESRFLPETTNRFQSLVFQALGEFKITAAKAAAMLGITVEMLNAMQNLANA